MLLKPRFAACLLLLVSTLFLALPAEAQEQVEGETVHEFTIERNTYVPTKITFNYLYTDNHSIVDMSTLGQSLYRHSGGPTFMEFEAQAVDTFRFSVVLVYSEPTEQNIIVGLWSGESAVKPMDGDSYKATFEKVVFNVALHVMQEPTYPTEEEVAQAVTAKIALDLANQQNMIQDLMRRLEVAQTTTSIVAVVVAVALAVVSVIVFTELRRVRRGE